MLTNRLLLILFLALPGLTFAQYYQTLPKGVRTFLIRNVKADVQSSYNKSKSESPYTYDINTSIDSLKTLENPLIQDALALLSAYPEAYNKISFGAHRFSANALVNVDAYGFGYGITNKITAYVGIPIYQAEVRMKYKRTKGNSIQEVADILQQETDSDYAQTLGNIIEQIYDIDGGVIQSALVNRYGYNELGSWHGSGLGDIETGVMYKLEENKNYGSKATLGLILPTGKVDDPDTLQDIGFGDGQLDLFAEIGGSYHLNKKTVLNSWLRYTYQFGTEKKLRVVNDDIGLSEETDTFYEKLGNKLDFEINSEYAVNDWFSLKPAIITSYTGESTYESEHTAANRNLADNTESHSSSFKFTSLLSSVNLYKAGTFLLPAQFTFTYLHVLNGRNTPKVNRLELEFSMFF